jgi:hypothetical protein
VDAPLLLGDARNPQRLNRYGYVLKDPVNFVDPDGFGEEPFHIKVKVVGKAPPTVREYGSMFIPMHFLWREVISATTSRAAGARGGGNNQVRQSHLRIREPEPITDERMELFFCLYKKVGFGGLDGRERIGFIVERATGWQIWMAPAKSTQYKETYSGPVPVGTIGFVHTHPQDGIDTFTPHRDGEHNDDFEWNDQGGMYRNVTGGTERISFSYMIHLNRIQVMDFDEKVTDVAQRGWTDAFDQNNCEGKIHEFKPSEQN